MRSLSFSSSIGVFYLLALLPRLSAIVTGWLRSEIRIENFVYLSRSGAFWDPLPLWFSSAALKASFGNPVLCTLYYALISSAAVPLVHALARSLRLPPPVPALSALLTAFYPYYVSAALYQPDVGITVTLTAATSLAFTTAMNKPFLKTFLLCNAFAVVLIAERSHSASFVGFLTLFVSVILFTRGGPERGRAVLLVLLFVTMLASYSGIRYKHYGSFSPFTQKSGYNLLQGHNPYIGNHLRHVYSANSEILMGPAAVNLPAEVQADLVNPKYSPLLTREAVVYIRQNPRETLVNTALKVKRYWDFRLEDSASDPLLKKLAYAVPYLITAFLALWGSACLLARGDLAAFLFLWGGLLFYAAPMIASIPLIRVRMYSEFLLLILSSIGILGLMRRPDPHYE